MDKDLLFEDSDGSVSNREKPVWGKRMIWILAARMDFQEGGFPCFRRWGFPSLWGWRLKFWCFFFFPHLFRLLHIYNDIYWNTSFYYNILLFHFLICDNVKVGFVFSHQKCDFLQNYFSFLFLRTKFSFYSVLKQSNSSQTWVFPNKGRILAQ